MSSLNWLSGLSMPEPPGNTSQLDDLDQPMPDEDFAAEAAAPVTTPAGLPRRVPFATSAVLDDLDAPVPYALPSSHPASDGSTISPASAVVHAAIQWSQAHQADAADVSPLQLLDADDALHMAVAAFRKAANR